MKVKDLFKGLEKTNEFNDLFGKEHNTLCVRFGECDYKNFETYKEFKDYIKEVYVSSYVQKLLNEEEHSIGNNYRIYLFHSCDVLCEVTFYLE